MSEVLSTPAIGEQGPKVFFSYSRSDAILVDELGESLGRAGYDPWIDYKSLEPGQPWDSQLKQGIEDSEVVLLVVSKRACASGNVKDEWTLARKLHRPIILVIAEAAPLDPTIAKLPWIDLRVRYRAGLADLIVQIENARAQDSPAEPATVAAPAPRHGFRAPLRVWLAFVTSTVVAAASLGAFWTLVLPFVLVPLPVRILRRSFNYTDVRNALLGLPFALIVTEFAFVGDQEELSTLGAWAFFVAFLGGLSLFLLIRSGSFRRWVEPAAARPHDLAPTLDRKRRTPKPVDYRVDVKSEDLGYALEVDRVLAGWGHTRVDDGGDAVTLRFVSQFHDRDETEVNQNTIPILVSDPDDALPDRLRRTQWIDLRRGLDTQMLDTLGEHLDRPNKFFAMVGSPPPHEQRVFPAGVQGLFVTIWITVGSIIGYLLLAIVGLRGELNKVELAALALSAGIGLAVILFALWLTHRLRVRRAGWLRASMLPLLATATFAYSFPILDLSQRQPISNDAMVAIETASVAVMIPVVLLLYFWIFQSAAIRRWLPPGTGRSSESATVLDLRSHTNPLAAPPPPSWIASGV